MQGIGEMALALQLEAIGYLRLDDFVWFVWFFLFWIWDSWISICYVEFMGFAKM